MSARRNRAKVHHCCVSGQRFSARFNRLLEQAENTPRYRARPPAPAPRPRTEPLGGERYCGRFTADGELYAQLQELRALMRHQVPDGDLGKILGRAVALLLAQVRKRKFGECSTPRPAKPVSASPSRHLPAAIRRAVSQRDGDRCSYVSPSGRRCGAREFLEFHHRDPWARTPSHSLDGISLRCRAHNQHAACQDFGERHMARFRKQPLVEPEVAPRRPIRDSPDPPAPPQLDSDQARESE